MGGKKLGVSKGKDKSIKDINRFDLSPAIASLIINHDVSNKEAFATLSSLIVRGYISVYGTRFSHTNKRENKLLNHERFIIHRLFSENKTINSSDVKYELATLGNNPAFKEAVAIDAVNQKVYKKSSIVFPLEKYRKGIRTSFKKNLGKFAVIWVIILVIMMIASPVLMGILASIMIFGSKILPGIIPENQPENMSICAIMFILLPFVIIPIVWIMFSVFIIITYKIFSKIMQFRYHISSYESEFLPSYIIDKGSRAYKDYMKIKEHLEKNTEPEYEWSNNYVGFQIAFNMIKDYDRFPL